MQELIGIDENGIAWVELEGTKIIGVVNSFKILDEDGLVYQDSNIEDFLDVEQDYNSECNVINFVFNNGESTTLRVYSNYLELV